MPHPIHPLHGRQLRAGSAWCASWGNETVASTAVPGEQPAAVLFFATGWFTLGVSLEQFSGVNVPCGRPDNYPKLRVKVVKGPRGSSKQGHCLVVRRGEEKASKGESDGWK